MHPPDQSESAVSAAIARPRIAFRLVVEAPLFEAVGVLAALAPVALAA